jgi:hypothetical protein
MTRREAGRIGGRRTFEATMDPERFQLEAAPATVKAAVVGRIREEHAQLERIARRQPDQEAFRRRAFFVTSNLDLVDCFDPAEGATPGSVAEILAARVEESGRSRLRTARWWARDLAVWQGGKLLATVTLARDGRPVVTVF